MNRLYRVLLLAMLFACGLAEPAHAGPVVGAVVLAAQAVADVAVVVGGFISSLGTFGQFLVVTGLNYAVRAITGKGASPQLPGVKGQIGTGEKQPLAFIVGKTCTAGSLEYANSFGKSGGTTPNANLTYVISLSDLPVTALTGIWVNDEKVTWPSTGTATDYGFPIAEYKKDGKDYLWVRFYDGTQAEADPWLVEQFGEDPERPYLDDMIGVGIAYVIVTARLHEGLFTGFPRYKFEVEGAKLYDPRKDTSVGGSGSHRFDNPATWEFTLNPKVVTYNVMRGIAYAGQWLYGLQALPAARLPLASWFAAMNECDVLVDDGNGGTEPQYRVGAEIPVSVPPADTIEAMLTACNGRMTEIGGVYKTTVGAAGSAVASITSDDIVISEQQQDDPFPSLDSTINGIAGRYPEPAEAYNTKDAPPLYDADLEAADGGRRLMADVDYSMVPYGGQVQRLMKSAKEEARKFRKYNAVLPPAYWSLEPLDVISVTNPARGFVNKLFRIDGGTDKANLDVAVLLSEVDPADYDFDPETDLKPVSSTSLTIVRPAAQAIVDWAVAPVTIDGDNGHQQAAIRMSWNTGDLDDVSGVLFEVRLHSDETVVLAGQTLRWDAGAVDISENILPNTQYDVRGKYLPASTRDTTWSDWLTITTDDVLVSEVDLAPGAVSITKIADDLVVVELVDTLPTTGNFEGRLVRWSVDNVLYEYHVLSGQFEPLVSAVNLDGQITAEQIAAGAVGVAALADSLVAVELVDDLPTEDNYEGRLVRWSFDGKLYEYDGDIEDWVPVIRADVLAGQITGDQITAATISADLFVDGLAGIERVGSLPASGNFDGRVVFYTVDKKLYRYDGTAGQFKASVPTTDLTGTITAAQIAAGAVTTAAFASGIVPVEILSSLPSTGNFDGRQVFYTIDKKLYRYDAGAGQFKASVATGDLTGTIATAQIAAGAVTTNELGAGAVVAAKIANATITATQIAASTITGSNIASATVTGTNIAAATITAGNIAAKAITAAKIVLTDMSNMVLDASVADSTVWRSTTGFSVSTSSEITSNLGASAGFAFAATGATGQAASYTEYWAGSAIFYYDVEPGKSYRLALNTRVKSGFNGYLRLYALWYSAALSNVSNNNIAGTDYRASPAGSDTNALLEGTVVAPSNAAFLRVQYQVDWPSAAASVGTLYGANPRLNRANDGALIVDGSVTAAKIASATIIASNIATDTITATQIAAGAIGTSEIAANAVTAAKIAANTITAAQIAAGTITTTQIASGTITASNIASDTITAGEIAAGAIGTSEIAANAVTAAKIAANTITAGQIAAATITTTQIASATITGTNIAAATIAGSNIIANTITAGNIAAATITGDKIATNTITASKLLVSSGANLLIDQGFSDTSYWTAYLTSYDTGSNTTSGLGVAKSVLMNSNGTTGQSSPQFTNVIPGVLVEPGKVYRYAASVYMTSGFNGQMKIQISYYNQAGSYIGASSTTGTDYRSSPLGSATKVILEAQSTALSTAYSAVFAITVTWPSGSNSAGAAYCAGLQIQRASDGVLIADNAITAAKIVAGTISASKIAIGDSTNYIIDPGFTDTSYWTRYKTSISSDSNVTSGLGASLGILFPSDGTNPQTDHPSVQCPQFLVEPGKAYRMAFKSYFLTGFNGRLVCQIWQGDKTGSYIGGNFTYVADYRSVACASNTLVSTDTIVTALSNAFYAYITWYIDWPASGASAGSCYMAYPRMNRAAGGELIVDGAITAAKIAANTITASQIASDTITAAQIAAGAITSSELAAGAVVAGKIAAGTIVAADIASGTITAAQIAAATITGSNIAAGTITASNLAANSITAGVIAAGAIGTTQLAAGAITADKLAVGAINASNIIADNVIVTGKLEANAITKTTTINFAGDAADYGTDYNVSVSAHDTWYDASQGDAAYITFYETRTYNSRIVVDVDFAYKMQLGTGADVRHKIRVSYKTNASGSWGSWTALDPFCFLFTSATGWYSGSVRRSFYLTGLGLAGQDLKFKVEYEATAAANPRFTVNIYDGIYSVTEFQR